jgi:outer membrane protein OmpA-like peptidoglycan-associated protein
MTVDTYAIRDQVSTGERRRRRVWLLPAAALLAIGGAGVLVALDKPNRELNSMRLVGTGEESGWWTRISIEEPRPPSPSTPAAPETPIEEARPAIPSTPAAPKTPAVATATIPSDVLFAESSAELDDSARERLRELATQLAESSGTIVVDGHTDLLGDDASNMRLGEERAGAVATLLVDLGVPAARIEVASFGETQPVCEQVNPDGSDNADCRARCRRVVVTYTVATEV